MPTISVDIYGKPIHRKKKALHKFEASKEAEKNCLAG